MRSFFLTTGPFIVWALTIAEIAIGSLLWKKREDTGALLSSLISFGLAIDAFIIALGVFLGPGSFLKGISQIRYILHGILVPLMIPIAFYLAKTMKKKLVFNAVWSVTLVFVVCGVIMGFITKTMPVKMAGILRYASNKAFTPAFANTMDRILSFGGVIPLIAMGAYHLWKSKRVWLLLSGLFMFAFSALAPATGNMDLNFLMSMLGELLMIIFFTVEVYRK